ncbi:MAG: hypothetical protein GTO02_10240, partial [Candidatus Dadabacteria bacterium]|nr:hypothetical protein [Candidatus Dadabacteria bacterium]
VFLAVATATVADLDLIIEINTDEGWKQLAVLFLGQGDWRYSNVFTPYTDPVMSAQGNGSDPVIRINTIKGAPDLKFRGFASATGEENP